MALSSLVTGESGDKAYEAVIKGWNVRRRSSSLKLSSMVPFVQLFVIYDPNDDADIPFINSIGDRLLDIKIRQSEQNAGPNQDDSIRNLKGVELGEIESQVGSLEKKGGVGITSLNVSRGTRESFSTRYEMDLTLTSPDIFKTREETLALINLNSTFLIMHGWAGNANGGQDFVSAPVVNGNVLEVTTGDINNGYWQASLVRLTKYGFSLDGQNHLSSKMTFLGSQHSKLIFQRATSIKNSVLQKLKKVTLPLEPTTNELQVQPSSIIIMESGVSIESFFAVGDKIVGAGRTIGPHNIILVENNELKQKLQKDERLIIGARVITKKEFRTSNEFTTINAKYGEDLLDTIKNSKTFIKNNPHFTVHQSGNDAFKLPRESVIKVLVRSVVHEPPEPPEE
tara:strand:+ start:4332 stop:5522 length:1191 start_codon:yes stop_codon:yes gene_type:complete